MGGKNNNKNCPNSSSSSFKNNKKQNTQDTGHLVRLDIFKLYRIHMIKQTTWSMYQTYLTMNIKRKLPSLACQKVNHSISNESYHVNI